MAPTIESDGFSVLERCNNEENYRSSKKTILLQSIRRSSVKSSEPKIEMEGFVFIELENRRWKLIPGHALHEKELQRQIDVGPLVSSQDRRALVVPSM